ncbi:YidH family protein [Mucilaginibacter arboris]|uniref:DUF202 domain-containing protein n=1 Tax=Mucilaginibacter arboris TaxID=2682090 RepID=A0A7K1SWH1_9SPHI|nr:DUF202 domain-containing protein [Mucilaginibacter arboris]MVN21588.1 DUF202 domain-containing protein [Mucilaginibacter arboris]
MLKTPPDTSTENQPLKQANASDHLANERTFLAWIRTSIAIMGFGFVVVKFTLFIRQLSYALGDKNPAIAGKGYSSVIGILLVAVGAILALLAYIRYRNIEQQLNGKKYYPSFWLSLVLTIALVVVSILLIWYLLPSITF